MLAAQPVHGEFAKEMQYDDNDECVRCVTVQASHDACRVPLLVGHVFDGRVGVDDAGIEEDVQVDTCRCGYPVEVPAEGAEPGEWIVTLTESIFEYAFGFGEQAE